MSLAKPPPSPADVLKRLRKIPNTKLTAREVVSAMLEADIPYSVISASSGVYPSVLRRHAVENQPISIRNAKKLEAWAHGLISLEKMLARNEIGPI